MPGVGKSEIAARLGKRLEEQGLTVAQPTYDLAHGIARPRRILRKSMLVLSESLRYPSDTWRSLRSVWATGKQPSMFGMWKLSFNWVMVSALARRADGCGEISLFDEGLFQGLWSLGLEGDFERVEALLRSLPGLVPLPQFLVISQASKGVVEERVRERPDNDSRLDSRMEQEPELLVRGAEVLKRLQQSAENELGSTGMQVLVLVNETDEDLEHNVGVLADLIGPLGKKGA